jgi:hypothetical protein
LKVLHGGDSTSEIHTRISHVVLSKSDISEKTLVEPA